MNTDILRLLTSEVSNSGFKFEDLNPKSKKAKLYNLLLDTELSEIDIRDKLFPKESDRAQFRVLKSRYFDFIVNLYSKKGFNESDFASNAHSESYLIINAWLVSKWSIRRKSYKAYVDILEGLYRKARKLELVEVDMILIQDLRFSYGLFLNNEKKFKKYKEEYEAIIENYNLFLQSKRIYTDLARIILKKDTSQTEKEILKLKSSFSKLENALTSSKYYYVKFYYFNSKYLFYLIENKHKELSEICTLAINYFSNKKYHPQLAIYQFHQNRGIAYLLVKDYKKALADFIKCLEFKPRAGTTSWQFTYSYIFHTQILQQDYQNAYETLAKVINHYSFKNLDVTFREPWYLKEAFINFLIKTGKVNPDNSPDVRIRNFRLGRFMNEVTVYSKDKTGFNITINIIQMLFLLIGENYDQALDKLDSLKQYNYKYLKSPEYLRSSSFIKMLLKIPESNYSKKRIQAKSKALLSQLQNNPMDFSEKSLSVEIIPYENLWEEILELFN